MLIYVESLDDHPNTKALYSTHKKATSKTTSEAYGIDLLQSNSLDFTTQICNSCFYFSHFIHIQGSWYLTVFSLRIFNFYLILLLFFFFHFCFSSQRYFLNPENADSPL